MIEETMDRERKLIEEIQSVLPELVHACNSRQSDFIIMSQEAFAPRLGEYEIMLLGKAIKYAGLMGREVRIIPSRPLAS